MAELFEARRLYLTAGYREIEPYNLNPYARHWMQKELPPAAAGPGLREPSR